MFKQWFVYSSQCQRNNKMDKLHFDFKSVAQCSENPWLSSPV